MSESVAASPPRNNVDYRFKLGRFQLNLNECARLMACIEQEVASLPIEFRDHKIRLGTERFEPLTLLDRINDIRSAVRSYQAICREGYSDVNRGADMNPRVITALNLRFQAIDDVRHNLERTHAYLLLIK